MTLKIAVAVHGRFHAFDLVQALLRQGHDVTLFTNYPKWAAARFGLPRDRVRAFWLHGLISRAAWQLQNYRLARYPESWLHRLFGRWVRDELARESWNVIHCWSGVAEEVFRTRGDQPSLRLLMRGSAHIRTQARLLGEEERRTGIRQEQPSPWIILREEREYRLADRIVVLSSFAYESFVEEGVPPQKLYLLPLGTSLAAFRPAADVHLARRRRILAGGPLRVLYVGSLSFRKGLWDLAAVVPHFDPQEVEFRFVGPPTPETAGVLAALADRVTLIPRQPQAALPDQYAWGDVFIFPTIEDGYAVVLAQAAAAGLPILTTTNCAGANLVRDGETGWIVPIRDPAALVARLRWALAHRTELLAVVDAVYDRYRPRDWDEVAAEFVALCIAGQAALGLEPAASGDAGRSVGRG